MDEFQQKKLSSKTANGEEGNEASGRTITEDSINVFLVFGIMGVVSFIGMGLYVIQFDRLKGASVFASGIIVSMSAFLIGGLLGVLFGIPKTLQHNSGSDSNSSNDTYKDNTNLEEISDWLTKALVGIGLSQMRTILDKLGELAGFLKPAFGNLDSSAAIAISLVILFTINGFFAGYIQARIILAKLLKSIESIKAGN